MLALYDERMHEVACDGRRRIDVESWERAAAYRFFSSFTEPFHGVCVRVDCTATYACAKQRGLPVFLSLMHRALAAAQQVENLRLRIAEGEVWLYDVIHASGVVARANGTIGFAYHPYAAGLEEFVRAAKAAALEVAQRNDLDLRPEQNLIHFSTLPWLDFTSIDHARNFAFADSVPRITFGKMTEAGGRRTMPVSIHAHHALADGLHVAQFVERFQAALDAPEATLD